VVTDDGGMTRVAEANSIECWSTIKLLRLMVTAGRIDMEKVAEILEYWDYEQDLPMPLGKLRQVFREYFGVDCPL
jgi:predicted solute-binding protein